MKNQIKTVLFFVFIHLCCIQAAFGYSSNRWHHKSTPQFTISYNERTAHLVDEVLSIANETAEVVGRSFGWDITNDHISIALNDSQDYSQGYSLWDYSLVRIDVRKTQMLFFRGETEYLRTILSHELSHIYMLRIMKSLWVLNVGLSAVSEKTTGSFLYSTVSMDIPQWFIEGVAQMGSYKLKADLRDPYREMLLKDACLNGRLLSLDEMAVFEGTPREYELVYNQGFDFVLFLNRQYPEKKIGDICLYVRDMGFSEGIIRYFDKTPENLYREWVDDLEKRFDEEEEKLKGVPLYEKKDRPYTTEVMSAQNGKCVISNWNSDYNHFDLFLLNDKRDKIEKTIKDVGQVLKTDFSEGSVYFNKVVYNRETGEESYDIFKITPERRVERVTKNARCLAFDVKNGHVMAAAYNNGRTDIVLKYPSGENRILRSFNHRIAVYAISMIDEASAVITIGAGDNIKAGILSEDRFHMIWDTPDADVFDCVFAGEGRLLFSSTLDGSPQLYWADIVRTPHLLYKITEVEGGVRLPGIEQYKDSLVVSCALFENGDHRRYLLEDPFQKNNPVEVDWIRGKENTQLKTPVFPVEGIEGNAFSNLVMTLPTVNLRFGRVTSGSLFSSRDATSLYSAGTTFSILNAPGNLELSFTGDFNIPVGYETSGLENFSHESYAGFHLWKFRVVQGFTLKNYYTESDMEGGQIVVVLKDTMKEASTVINYQLFKDEFLAFSYGFRFDDREGEFTLKENKSSLGKNDIGRTFESHTGGFYFHHYTDTEKFDPGNLGTPYFQVGIGMDAYWNRYPAFNDIPDTSDETIEDGFIEDETEIQDAYLYDDITVTRTCFDISKRVMLLKNSMSLEIFCDGFYYDGGTKPDKIALYAYDYLGTDNYFSGYTPYTIKIRKSVRGGLTVRYNPFINIFDTVKKCERLNVGLKIEAGTVDYFEKNMRTTEPVSIEGSVSYSFYYRTDRKSYFYIKYASPLNRIDDLQDTLSGRVSVGLEL